MEKKEKDELPPGIDEFLEISDGDYPIEVSEELVFYIKSRSGLEKEIIEIVLKQVLLAMRYFLIKQKVIKIPQLCEFYINKGFKVRTSGIMDKLRTILKRKINAKRNT